MADGRGTHVPAPVAVPAPAAAAERSGLRVITLVLAVACGLTVANLYYAQPLLELISGSLRVGRGATGLVVTLTQLGYAAGLLFVLPLGDLIETRTLAARVLIGTSLAALAAALAPSFAVFAVAAVLLGITSVVAQILVPLAAHLAPEQARGRIVGQVMSGLILGILLARTVSSLVAGWLGWRAIFFLSAALMLALVPVLNAVVPTHRPDHTDSYRTLLSSTLEIARQEPILRLRAICQACLFGAFSAFWTAVAYELVDAHGLSQTGIAVFALVGAGGAVAAPIAGRIADRGWGRAGSGVALTLGVLAMVLAAVGSANLVLLAVAGLVLDLAVQAHQVFGQQEIYALRADARARINTVYMSSVFLGGALASAVAGVLHAAYGWTGVCIFAAGPPLLGLVIWSLTLRPGQARRAATHDADPRVPTGDADRWEPID